MKSSTDSLDRRTVLQSLIASATAGVAGCNDSTGVAQSDPFTYVGVTGTTLVIEFEENQSVDQLTVIQPDGESFANRSVASGSTREEITIGTQYPAGEYTIHALDGEETLGERTLSIAPDIQITDLKLGRNHPEEMYDEAGESTIRSEVILTIENNGTGPESVTQLLFEGDVPQPTEEESHQSGLYNTTSEVGGEADQIVVPPDESKTVYSTSRPFTSASSNVTCTPEGEHGQFTAIVHLRIEQPLQRRYEVKYTGEELIECDIAISEADQ